MFKYIIHSLLRLSTRFLPVQILICAWMIQSLISLLPPETAGRALGQLFLLWWMRANGQDGSEAPLQLGGGGSPTGPAQAQEKEPPAATYCESASKKVTAAVSELCLFPIEMLCTLNNTFLQGSQGT